jgi:hypothetical protein
MARNQILQELYETRDEILAEHGGDVDSYLRDAQRRLVESGRPIAKVRQRRISPKANSSSVVPSLTCTSDGLSES